MTAFQCWNNVLCKGWDSHLQNTETIYLPILSSKGHWYNKNIKRHTAHTIVLWSIILCGHRSLLLMHLLKSNKTQYQKETFQFIFVSFQRYIRQKWYVTLSCHIYKTNQNIGSRFGFCSICCYLASADFTHIFQVCLIDKWKMQSYNNPSGDEVTLWNMADSMSQNNTNSQNTQPPE